MVERTIQSGFSSLKDLLGRLDADMATLGRWGDFGTFEVLSISSGLGDRHRDAEVMSIAFANGRRLVYKPVPMQADELFGEFVDSLGLKPPYDLKCLRCFPRHGYGWSEYVEHEDCHGKMEFTEYYRRAGVLLALCEILGYTDGHFENVVASAGYPVLVDGETLYQNFHRGWDEIHPIVRTMLLQAPIEFQGEQYCYSAFQGVPQGNAHSYRTVALDDGTDNLSLGYYVHCDKNTRNAPVKNGIYGSLGDCQADFMEGYRYGYRRVLEERDRILAWSDWWDRLRDTRVRIVMRKTASYTYLIRRIQQPDICTVSQASEFLRSILRESPFVDYEVQDLLNLNIPYFWQRVGESAFYDADGRRYDGFLDSTGEEGARNRIARLSLDGCDKGSEVINNLLRATIWGGRAERNL